MANQSKHENASFINWNGQHSAEETGLREEQEEPSFGLLNWYILNTHRSCQLGNWIETIKRSPGWWYMFGHHQLIDSIKNHVTEWNDPGKYE